MKFKMGIDLGGTKTEVIVLDSNLQPVYRRRLTTPADSYDGILNLLTELVNKAQDRFEPGISVGIGIPGASSPRTGLLRNSNTVCLNGRPFLGDLENRLDREIRVENDANCFALSEALHGVAMDYPVVLGVIIGTGTGAGLVIDGKLVNGPHSISGEWGHNPLPWLRTEDARTECYCGKTACIETYLSGPGLEHSYQAVFGKALNSKDIVAGASMGDSSCRRIIDSYHDQMARGLAHVINILDPHAIVLGGGMSNIDSIYHEVPRLLPSYVFSDFVTTPLLKAKHGDASGVYGAALLWE